MINLGLEKYVLGNMKRGSLIISPFKASIAPQWDRLQLKKQYSFFFPSVQVSVHTGKPAFSSSTCVALCFGSSCLQLNLLVMKETEKFRVSSSSWLREAVSLRHSAEDSISSFTFSCIVDHCKIIIFFKKLKYS